MIRSALMGCLLTAFTACIVPAPSDKQQERDGQKVAAPAAPAMEVRNGANLEDKVEIVGATVTPGKVTAGESVKVTVLFKVLAEISNDYLVFVHIEDVDGKADRLNADHAPMGGTYPTSKWKVGETVRDEFAIYVPPGMQVRGINVLLGLWDQKTDARMKLKNPEQVRNDGNSRILIAQIPVGP